MRPATLSPASRAFANHPKGSCWALCTPNVRYVTSLVRRDLDPTMLGRLRTGNEADAELIYVTGREKVQVIDHAVVTTYE